MEPYKDSTKVWSEGRTFIRYVVDTVREPFLLLDKDLKIVSANESFYKFFMVSKEETEGEMVYDIGNKQWNIPHLKKLLEDILPKETFFKDFEMEHDFPVIGKKTMLLNARMMFLGESETSKVIILAMEDISKQRMLDEKLQNYSEDLEKKVAERTEELGKRIDQLEKMSDVMQIREKQVLDLQEQVRLLTEKLEEAIRAIQK